MDKEKGQKVKQWSIKHQKTKNRANQAPKVTSGAPDS